MLAAARSASTFKAVASTLDGALVKARGWPRAPVTSNYLDRQLAGEPVARALTPDMLRNRLRRNLQRRPRRTVAVAPLHAPQPGSERRGLAQQRHTLHR